MLLYVILILFIIFCLIIVYRPIDMPIYGYVE
jgi:hypothetical protein